MMKGHWNIFGIILLFFGCFSNAQIITYQTSSGDLLNQVLESQICEAMPHLPSCAAINETLKSSHVAEPVVDVFQGGEFLTLVMDYIASTQRLNRELIEFNNFQVDKIRKLEQTKEQLEYQLRNLEEEWLPSKDNKISGVQGRSDIGIGRRSSSIDSKNVYQPTASLLRPADCSDYLVLGAQESGIYDIYPFKCRCSEPVKVWCDMETDGGGWTVFLKRQNSSNTVSFNRTWVDYKEGFGNVSNEYWIGNDHLHMLTNTRQYTVRLDFQLKDGGSKWSEWSKIVVGSEAEKYKLEIGSFNSLSMTTDCMSYHNGKVFSTPDYDNDGNSGSCAVSHKGGFWYHNCALLYPTASYNDQGNMAVHCPYVSNGKNIAMDGPSLQLKIRPRICDQKVKAVHFNSHTCESHNGD